jgi:hypothetical protein
MNEYELSANRMSEEELLKRQAEVLRADAEILNKIADDLNDIMIAVSRIASTACTLSDDQIRVYEDVIDEPIHMFTKKIQQFHREAAQKEAAANALDKDPRIIA